MRPVTNMAAEVPSSDHSPVRSADEVQLVNEWQAWAKQVPPGSGESRDIAVRRLEECIARRSDVLYLSELQLTSLPKRLPDCVTQLDIRDNCLTCLSIDSSSLWRLIAGNNRLTCLPEALPSSLKAISVPYNQLASLPASLPSRLCSLLVSHNQLTSLPETLPDSLEFLYVNRNRLVALPARLPSSLRELEIRHNQLTSLPETLPDSLEFILSGGKQLTNLPAHLPRLLKGWNISYNRLTCLPKSLPDSLECFGISHNRLMTLPADLPHSLKRLNVSGNPLTALPANLSALTELCANNCRLTALPESLPDSLQILKVERNRLTALPASLPDSLRELFTSHNQLTSLPENLPNSLQKLFAANNPLNEFAVSILENGNFENHWTHGLKWFLVQITLWDRALDKQRWETIYREDHAGFFGRFLEKLHQGRNEYNKALQCQIADWLAYLAKEEHGELRKQIFLLAQEAKESCVDRASLYFNHMHIMQVEHRLLSRDVPIAEIIEAIRGNFRLHVLEGIAARHAAARRQSSTNFREEPEIYLAYQYELRAALSLPIYTELQFARLAGLGDADLRQAEEAVAEAEKTDFLRYWLTESALWAATLEKWDAEKKVEADESYLDAISSDSFNAAVSRELREKGIAEEDEDARRNLSQSRAAELFFQQRYQLTQKLLAAHSLCLSTENDGQFRLDSLPPRMP